MALKPVTFKIDEAEINKLEREAQARPDKSRSAYVRDIVMARPKPLGRAPRLPQKSED